MSGLPPQLDTADTGSPAQDWARSTTTAAFARSQPASVLSSEEPSSSPRADLHSAVRSSPAGNLSVSAADDAQKGAFDPKLSGTSFPGAYPDTPDEKAATAVGTSATETAQRAAGTASDFIQSAATTAAGYIPQGVYDVVSSYIREYSAPLDLAFAC